MATELEMALFAQELDDVRRLPEASRWHIERDDTVPLGIYVEMHPASAVQERYRVRVRWTDYFEPFSLKFVNIETGAIDDPTAWPQCHGFRPSSQDACLPWTAEGHILHPEWKGSAKNSFPQIELPMRYALLQIQSSLDNSYQGRGHL